MCFVTLVYGSVLIKHLIFESPNLNLYGHWPKNLAAVQFLSNEVPRSSGISRSSFILMIPLGFYFLINKKLNYKIYFFYLFFSFLMLATQSRITLLGYLFGVLVFTFYIFFLPTKNNFNDKLKKFLIIIILPVFTWAASLELLSLTRSTPAFLEYFSDKFRNENIDDEEKYKKLFRKSNKKSFSSNRTKDWRNIFDKNQNYFFGYGALGDRHLIDQSASSLHFYNYASGGIFAVFVFFILIF